MTALASLAGISVTHVSRLVAKVEAEVEGEPDAGDTSGELGNGRPDPDFPLIRRRVTAKAV
jgi:hypothetical protein